MALKRYKRKSKGVPKGFHHKWKYDGGLWEETKLKKGLWKFKYRSSKHKRSKSYGNFGRGTKGIWQIKAKQYIIKRGKGRYDTIMIGTKRPIKFNVKIVNKKK